MKDMWRKGVSVGVALSLIILVIVVLIPTSTTAVHVSCGIPSDSSVDTGTTIYFENVNLAIRAAEVIPVNFLTFQIFDSSTDHRVAWVRFTIMGDERSENPPKAFTVVNVTDTSVLPSQCKGDFYGYDERTGYNVTGFHHGFGYGYGYGNPDLVIVYNITFKTCKPGTYYAKLSVKASKYTYTSEETALFTILPQPPLSVSIEINPGCWPNRLNLRHRYMQIAILGTDTFDVHSINPKTLALSFYTGKKTVKPLNWWYTDIQTSCGHKSKGDGNLDLVMKFRCHLVIYVFQLYKYHCKTLRFTLTGTLKKTLGSTPFCGSDFIQITKVYKH